MTLLDLCSYLGLGAAGAATVNLLLGLLMSMRYSPVRMWPHRRINLFMLHQWTAYLTVTLTITHPLVLLFQSTRVFRVVDLFWPLHSPLQPTLNTVGALAAYIVLLLVGSSLLRAQLGRPVWRRLHYLAFPMMVLLFIHSILTDPELKDGHPDLLDGGKVFLEIACVVSVAAVVARLWLRGRGMRPLTTTGRESFSRPASSE